MELSQNDFLIIRDYTASVSGNYLNDDKMYLVKQRFEELVHKYNLKSFSELALMMKNNPPYTLRYDVIETVTTNETYFFRDETPFVMFRQYLLPLFRERIITQRKNSIIGSNPVIRILSAASSSGQEAYTLGMQIKEFVNSIPVSEGIKMNNFEIIGIDISEEMIKKAKEGFYTDNEVKRGLNELQLAQYFTKREKRWVINDDIKKIISFRNANFQNPISGIGKFDFVLCRNVIIYFDMEMKKRVLNQMYDLMQNDGFFLLGSTENTYGMTDKFDSVHKNGTILYNKKLK